MKRHDFIVFTLVRAGFRTSLKGFAQFCLSVELYLDDSVATIDKIYEIISVRFSCSKSAVEKNIRRLILSSDAGAAASALFGADVSDASNKEIVALFANYVALHYERSTKNGAQSSAAIATL
ncbi:MAG: hypothetical protein J1F39_03600 [Clostridiales bacterium]|nr:hypothetical protein [Clostridiales bacterium]